MKKLSSYQKLKLKREMEARAGIIVKQTPADSPELSAAIQRIFNNEHTQEDLLRVGDKIKEFRGTDLWLILVTAVDYVVNSELEADKKTGINNDEVIGIQRGARRVLSTISGLERTATIINKQMDLQRKQQELDNEDNPADPEDNAPKTITNTHKVGI